MHLNNISHIFIHSFIYTINQEMMKVGSGNAMKWILSKLRAAMLRCLFAVLSIGPIPNHIAFIMDGNRRYGKKRNLKEGMGHRLGFLTLMSKLKYCYNLGIQHITIYAFSIENFKRRPEEVQSFMDLTQEKMDILLEEDSFLFDYGVRVYIVGDLTLLNDSVRATAERLMEATSKHSKVGLSVCIAYTSTNEIMRAVEKACEERFIEEEEEEEEKKGVISLVEVEKHLDMSVAPDPDIIIRTSGETRLSNFLLWQSSHCLLYSPSVEWPEIGGRHLAWAILNFQRMHSYLEKKKKQL